MNEEPNHSNYKKKAYVFIILFGVVSLLGDFVYEGGRSVAGPYLGMLGASVIVIGIVSGLGEFLGYALRIATGWTADKTTQYWTLAILGYGLIFCIPLIAFTGYWQIAAMLYIFERIGKAIRTPSRDVLLSGAAKNVGRGWGFGVHEAMDQIGAVIGPLTFTAIFILHGGYKTGFAFLLVPAFLCIAFVLFTRSKYPHPEKMENLDKAFVQDKVPKELSPMFWYYCTFTLLVVIAFSSFPVMSYHWSFNHVVSDDAIPIYYALAMGIAGAISPLVGKAYDKYGLVSLTIIPILTIPIPFLAFTNSWSLALVSVVFWGAAIGVHETIMRAAIADLTHIKKRGMGYGIFNTIYGMGLFIGATIMGFLYSWNMVYIMIFVTIMVIASLPALVLVRTQCHIDTKLKK